MFNETHSVEYTQPLQRSHPLFVFAILPYQLQEKPSYGKLPLRLERIAKHKCFCRFAREFNLESGGSKLFQRWLAQSSDNPVEGVCGRSLFAKQEIFLSIVSLLNVSACLLEADTKELQLKGNLFDCPQIQSVARLTCKRQKHARVIFI